MGKIILNLNVKINMQSISIYDYTHIRAYHACRPISIKDYLDNGIIPYTKYTAMKDALHRLSTKKSERQIKETFNEIWMTLKPSKPVVWLTLNKRELLTDAGHYLIYGSEFLNSLAIQLKCREYLKDIGIPTIFSCDIPIEDISAPLLSDIELCVNKQEYDDISICVSQVKSENIISVEHPERIENPYETGSYYQPDYNKLINTK